MARASRPLMLVSGSARWSESDQGVVASLHDPTSQHTVTCVITRDALRLLLDQGLDANDYLGATFRFRQRITAIAGEKIAAGALESDERLRIDRVDIGAEITGALDELRGLLVRTSPSTLNSQALADAVRLHHRLAAGAAGNRVALAKLRVILDRAEAMWSISDARKHSAGPEALRNDAIRALDTVRQLMTT